MGRVGILTVKGEDSDSRKGGDCDNGKGGDSDSVQVGWVVDMAIKTELLEID